MGRYLDYPAGQGETIPNATTTADGFMSAADKAKLDGLVGGSGSTITQSTSFTAAVGNHYRVDTSGGSVTATLPAAAAANEGQEISFIKIAAANTMTLSSASLINGETTQAVTAIWDAVTVRSTGSTWDVVA